MDGTILKKYCPYHIVFNASCTWYYYNMRLYDLSCSQFKFKFKNPPGKKPPVRGQG